MYTFTIYKTDKSNGKPYPICKGLEYDDYGTAHFAVTSLIAEFKDTSSLSHEVKPVEQDW